MTRPTLVAALLAAALVQPALAQQVAPEAALRFLDADRDGTVVLNDYLNFQLPKLSQFDADQDGELGFKEFKASLQGKAQQRAQASFTAFNREGRGRSMNQREFLGYHAYVFKNVLDANRDGILSAGELAKVTAGD
jgi:EF hand